MELTIDQALQKGIEAHKAGKAQEADRYYTAVLKANPKHPDANHNMGVLAVGVGKVQEALPFFKTALEANPSISQFWLSYINALIKLDRMADAKAVFDQAKSKGAKGDGFDQIEENLDVLKTGTKISVISKNSQEPPKGQLQSLVNLYVQGQYHETLTKASQLLKEFPKSINLYNIIGSSNHSLGQLEEAIEAYTKALSIKPDYAAAHYNIGASFREQGKLGKAIAAYTKALSIKPDYFEAYNNMGITFSEQGKVEKAIEAYTKALSIKPDYAEAYNNMGNSLEEQGKLEEAIEAYNKAISIKPDYAEAYNNMGIILKSIKFTKPNRDLQKIITSILAKNSYVRPSDIIAAALSLLKLDQRLEKHLRTADAELIETPQDVISDLIKLPLLLKLMTICPLPDLELEKLFKNLRNSILKIISSSKEVSPKLLQFQSALALQCFINEYIYAHTEEEEKILQSLDASIKQTLKNKEQPSPQVVLALASYKSLNHYKWYNLLLVNDHILDVFKRQILEPEQETNLKCDLSSLEKITDKVSKKVRKQYEENPYPRWINLGLRLRPLSTSELVDERKLKLFSAKITEVEKPEILIAGCGTGQHSIETAASFKSSNVLAIDLSLSSLAYAKRKTKELSVKNIEYMQADILDLGQLNRQFDIIESGGVLHHMNNPMAGWKVLADCLKPGGLMNIGLYSEIAREHIVKIRKEISQQNIKSKDVEIRSFREMITRSEEDHHKLIIQSSDFYTMSTIKDLLFHVKEHRFTIAEIKDHLFKLGLKFCGFISHEIVSNFKQTNTCIDDPYDLDKWQAYEEANPRAFAGMYQFWCQKVD